MHVDAGKHLGIGRGALGVDLGDAGGDVLPGFFQDEHHVESGTPAHADQHQLHRPAATILPAVFRRPVHDNLMAAVGGTFETNLSGPLDSGLHDRSLR